MRSDAEIKKDLEDELSWDPDVDATDIAVSVKDGVATLTGFVRSYLDKWTAGGIAKRMAGVRGVANDIEVCLPLIDKRPDPELARAAVAALEAELPSAHERISVIVKRGRVSLEGDVEWHHQKERAGQIVRRIHGVKAVTNLLWVTPTVQPKEVKRNIEAALKRIAEIDAAQIIVDINGSEVALRGKVRSWAEMRTAEEAAWRAPGVTRVANQLTLIA